MIDKAASQQTVERHTEAGVQPKTNNSILVARFRKRKNIVTDKGLLRIKRIYGRTSNPNKDTRIEFADNLSLD